MRKAKPDMIRTLSVENYKSLASANVSLGPLVALVGPNASGKSNIVDALRLLRDLAMTAHTRTTVGSVIEARGGYRSVVWGGETQRDVSVEVEWETSTGTGGAAYNILVALEQGQAVVKAEVGSLAGVITFLRDAANLSGYSEPTNRKIARSMTSVLAAALEARSELREFTPFGFMAEWAFHHFSTSLMRPPQKVTRQDRLTSDGSNLSAVLHTLFSDGAKEFESIFDFVRTVVPDAEKLISPITPDGQTYVAVQERGVPAPVGSGGLSDGTLFSLALATALVTPQLPPLVCLEAPDTEMHPYAMESVAESLVAASQKTQVIITTHSPFLLNQLPPESVVVVEKEQGKTTCWNAASKKDVLKAMKLLGAGDAWYSGHLRSSG